MAKACVALDRLLGRGDDSAELILSASAATPELADRALQSFVEDNLGRIDAELTRTWRRQ